MLSTQAGLALFYVGVGFVILLGWIAIAVEMIDPVQGARRQRFRRLAVTLSVAGLLHPAFAFTARDITLQLGRGDDGALDPGEHRHLRRYNVMLAISIGVAAVVLASHADRFATTQPFTSIRSGLPFA